MAQEYIAVKQKNEIGVIALSKQVFQTIALIAIEEEPNVVLGEITPFKYPLNVKTQDDKLVITLEIKIKYNVNVNEVCARLQNKIYDSIAHMSDYIPDIIDIKVTGFVF
ncbi:MAG: Asp23/Gls24 family envelope stress response protein [Erysipelotrichaceae bacterium]